LREVQAATFSDIRLTDGGKVVSPTRRPLFTSRTIPGSHLEKFFISNFSKSDVYVRVLRTKEYRTKTTF
jgi:hypothetical protein